MAVRPRRSESTAAAWSGVEGDDRAGGACAAEPAARAIGPGEPDVAAAGTTVAPVLTVLGLAIATEGGPVLPPGTSLAACSRALAGPAVFA